MKVGIVMEMGIPHPEEVKISVKNTMPFVVSVGYPRLQLPTIQSIPPGRINPVFDALSGFESEKKRRRSGFILHITDAFPSSSPSITQG